MLSYAGPHTSFPVIAAGRDAAATAEWLANHLADPAAAARATTGRTSASGDVREYDYPYGTDLPHDLMVDGEGQIVITGMMTHRMLVLDPETGEYDEVPIPVPGANPRAVDIDDAGDWWVLLGGPRKIARYRAADGAWSTHDIGMYPHSVVAENGRVWFNGHFTSRPPRVGYVDAATGAVEMFDLPLDPAPEADPIPYGLRVGPDGTVWVTELRGNRIVRLDPGTGATKAYMMPTPISGPRRPDIGPDGSLWIPEFAANTLTRFDPVSESFERYPLPLPDALPYVVRVDADRGTVWIGTGAADALVAFQPETETFTVHPLPSRGALVRHIDIDPRTGDVWAAYGASPGIPPKIARLRMAR